MMMALGGYVFAVDTAAYGSLRRSVEYGWKSTPRVGKRPMQEFISRGDERIELSGVIYPEYRGGIAQVDVLRVQAGLGEPLALVGGDGRVFGLWVVLAVDETQTEFDGRGQARRIAFRVQLGRYGLSLGEYARRAAGRALGI